VFEIGVPKADSAARNAEPPTRPVPPSSARGLTSRERLFARFERSLQGVRALHAKLQQDLAFGFVGTKLFWRGSKSVVRASDGTSETDDTLSRAAPLAQEISLHARRHGIATRRGA
jgi:hypothetical protein